MTAISFCTRHPALLGDAMTLSVAQDRCEDDMIQPCSSMYQKLRVQDVQTDMCQYAWLFDFENLDRFPVSGSSTRDLMKIDFKRFPNLSSWSNLNERLKRLSSIQGKWRNLVQLCLLPQWTCGNCLLSLSEILAAVGVGCCTLFALNIKLTVEFWRPLSAWIFDIICRY